MYTDTHIYIFKRVYLGCKLLLRQVLLDAMEHCLSFLIVIFQLFLLFFLCWDPGSKEIVFYHQDPDTRKITKRVEKLQLM